MIAAGLEDDASGPGLKSLGNNLLNRSMAAEGVKRAMPFGVSP